MKNKLPFIVCALVALLLALIPVHSATVTTGLTFTTNQTVQYYDLNNAINNASVSGIVSGDITDGTIANSDLGANAVTTQKILDGTILGTDLASRTLTQSLHATNSIAEIELNTNIVFRAGFLTFSNSNVNLIFSSNQVAVVALSTNGTTTGQVYGNTGTGSGAVTVLNPNIAIYEDQKASGTIGGTGSATAWTTHILNTEVADTASLGSVSANVIALTAGTYRVTAHASFFATGNGKIRLRNTSDSTTLVVGQNTSANAGGNGGSISTLSGRFTIATTKNIELQYYISSSAGTGDLGSALTSGEVEVYANVTFIKE